MNDRLEVNYHLVSRTFNIPQENVDTDQIIPAQFLTTTSREGLGKLAFYNWRFSDDGQERADHLLRELNTKQNSILVAGNNIGCGSSREHAPWALLDMGFRAVISTQIADIFRNNSIKNGLLPIVVSKAIYQYLLEHPNTEISINVQEAYCEIEGLGRTEFELDAFSRYCLSRNYDQLDFLLSKQAEIKAYEQTRPSYLKAV